MDSCARRVAVRVEQWEMRRKPGELVAEGEVLGYFARRPVRAPYSAVVEDVVFERESRTWLVMLVENVRCA